MIIKEVSPSRAHRALHGAKSRRNGKNNNNAEKWPEGCTAARATEF
jgi:hypothetical protein